MTRARLADFADLSVRCHDDRSGFAGFRALPVVAALGWPDDPLEQWLYDHAGNVSFQADYEQVDLSRLDWQLKDIPVGVFLDVRTGPSDNEHGDLVEYLAGDHEHWLGLRDPEIAGAWETRGTWLRPPLLIDRGVFDPPAAGLQLIEGRTRVGILRGRHRAGELVAGQHQAWVARPR